MYSIKVDSHVHSIASIHSYSTIEECAKQASKKNLSCIAITDHFGPVFSYPSLFQSYSSLSNMKCLPSYINGVRVLRGVEIDIVDIEGHLAFYNTMPDFSPNVSICDRLMNSRELVIASVHAFGRKFGTINQNTQMYINALLNPYVNIIGHCDRDNIQFDLNEILYVAKKGGKIIEINNHSLSFGEDAFQRCKLIAEKCAQKGVYISVGSDAHSAFSVGEFNDTITMLETIDFPQNLIANADENRLFEVLSQQSHKKE
ncbi:MAG: hypothetical protein K0S01_2444 [Herbinix sp.]|jgi:putative hydrolase|nr:hypothetical protein [Herbinix sp.]